MSEKGTQEKDVPMIESFFFLLFLDHPDFIISVLLTYTLFITQNNEQKYVFDKYSTCEKNNRDDFYM